MTTIKSRFGQATLEVTVTAQNSDYPYLYLHETEGNVGVSAEFPRAEVLAALGVPADWEELVTKAKRDMAEVLIRVETVTVERDAHAATVGRVKAWAVDYYGVWDEAPDELRAALDPKPELPTEPGSVIFIDADVTQERDGILAACQRDGRFRALDGSAGGWDRDTITAWRPAKVVAE